MIPITSQCSGMAAIGPIHGGAAGSTCASDRALSVADRMRAVGSPSAVPDSCVNAAQRCAASDFAGVAADWAHVGWTINSEAPMYPPKGIHLGMSRHRLESHPTLGNSVLATTAFCASER